MGVNLYLEKIYSSINGLRTYFILFFSCTFLFVMPWEKKPKNFSCSHPKWGIKIYCYDKKNFLNGHFFQHLKPDFL